MAGGRMVVTNLDKLNTYEIKKVRKLLSLVLERYSDENSTCSLHWTKKIYKGHISKSVTYRTKECLTSHRFKEATKLMEILSLDINRIDQFMLLAGLQVLENSHSIPMNSVLNFIRKVKFLRNVLKREVLLEYLIFCLKIDIGDCNSNIQSLLTSFGRKKFRSNFVIDPLLDAYLGILSYINWVKQVAVQPESVLAVNDAEKAQVLFKKAIRLPGQWDIFVIKLVEILEFYKKYEEALESLTLYIDNNPDYINGYMYMFHFLHKYNKNLEQQMKCLKELLKLSPSDAHVFYIIELLKNNTNGIEKSLRYMFLFLDYPIHKNNLRAWKILSELTLKVLEFPVPTQYCVMTTCWKQRAEFWKRMHFSKWNSRILCKEDAKVALQKAIFLCVFEEKHPFVQTVLVELNKYDNLYSELTQKLNFLRQVKED